MGSTSRDKLNFICKVEHIKSNQKIFCKCFTKTFDNPQGDSNKRDIIDFNIDKVIRELNDSLNCHNSKNQAIKGNINNSVNANTDNNYRNSNAIYYHDFAQNPVDIFNDELIFVEAVRLIM